MTNRSALRIAQPMEMPAHTLGSRARSSSALCRVSPLTPSPRGPDGRGDGVEDANLWGRSGACTWRGGKESKSNGFVGMMGSFLAGATPDAPLQDRNAGRGKGCDTGVILP